MQYNHNSEITISFKLHMTINEINSTLLSVFVMNAIKHGFWSNYDY